MKAVSRCVRASAVPLLALLAACGGGGGGSSDSSAIRIAQESCAFSYAPQEPAASSGDDPLLPRQWHLRNEGQFGGRVGEDVRALAAWSASGKGEGVRLAIVDDAIETLHEDLFPNLAAFRNYRSGAPPDTHPLPCDAGDDHGTAVAGIAAARDGNGLGVAGVAPRVQLAAYNALSTGSEADVADALRRDAAVTAIYNNSWGSPDQRGTLNPSDATFRNAILDGTRLARGGLGAVYVFPAGNGGCAGASGCDDSNYDGFVNARGVIAVCAVDSNGRAPVWAESGANILVCGMSDSGTAGDPAITTTDVDNTYRSDFTGTSASTPMVAGVAALVLQANPALTWRDVQLILAATARKNDPGDGRWQTNAAGMAVHPFHGFGVADAQAATALARTWTSVGGSDALRTCRPPARTVDQPLNDGTVLSDTIRVDAVCPIGSIEFVEVTFNASHSYDGDLRIELQRPDLPSPSATLADSRVCTSGSTTVQCGDYDDGWVFKSVRNLGEPAQGEWTLKVTDAQAGDAGRWIGWSLTIWGR